MSVSHRPAMLHISSHCAKNWLCETAHAVANLEPTFAPRIGPRHAPVVPSTFVSEHQLQGCLSALTSNDAACSVGN